MPDAQQECIDGYSESKHFGMAGYDEKSFIVAGVEPSFFVDIYFVTFLSRPC